MNISNSIKKAARWYFNHAAESYHGKDPMEA